MDNRYSFRKKDENKENKYWSVAEYRLFLKSSQKSKIDHTMEICTDVCDLYIDAMNDIIKRRNPKDPLTFIKSEEFMSSVVRPKIAAEEGVYKFVKHYKIHVDVIRNSLIYNINKLEKEYKDVINKSKSKNIYLDPIKKIDPCTVYVEDKRTVSFEPGAEEREDKIKIGKDYLRIRNLSFMPFEYNEIQRISILVRNGKHYVQVLYSKEKEKATVKPNSFMTVDLFADNDIHLCRYDRITYTSSVRDELIKNENRYQKLIDRRKRLLVHYYRKLEYNNGEVTKNMKSILWKTDRIAEQLQNKRKFYINKILNNVFSSSYPEIVFVSIPTPSRQIDLIKDTGSVFSAELCRLFYVMLIHRLSKIKGIYVKAVYINRNTCPLCGSYIDISTDNIKPSYRCQRIGCSENERWTDYSDLGSKTLYNMALEELEKRRKVKYNRDLEAYGFNYLSLDPDYLKNIGSFL